MAEFNFVSTLREAINITQLLFEIGCYAVPSIMYNEKEYDILRTFYEIQFERTKGWKAFYFSKLEWGDYRFQIDEIDNIHVGQVYMINSKWGPPNIAYSYCDSLKKSSDEELVIGFMSTYNKYWVDDLVIKIPEEMKETYVSIIRRIRSQSVRFNVYNRPYWFSKNAWKLISSNQAESPVELRLRS